MAGGAGEDRAHREDRQGRHRAGGRGGRGGRLTRTRPALLLIALGALAAFGCPKRDSPRPKRGPAPPLLAESPLPPSGNATLALGPLRYKESTDGTALYVEGTVENTGSVQSHAVTVRVAGFDEYGTPIARGEALPTPQQLPPGTIAAFVVRLPNDPAIRRFHVEAVGR